SSTTSAGRWKSSSSWRSPTTNRFGSCMPRPSPGVEQELRAKALVHGPGAPPLSGRDDPARAVVRESHQDSAIPTLASDPAVLFVTDDPDIAATALDAFDTANAWDDPARDAPSSLTPRELEMMSWSLT